MFDADVRDTVRERKHSLSPERRAPWQLLQQRKVAALELSPSSFHLAVAELDGANAFRVTERATERVQLTGIFEHAHIASDAFERGLSAVRRLRDTIHRHAPEAVIAVASAALREAGNGLEFMQAATRASGIPICTLEGIEAARLTALGATQTLALEGRRVALFDIGASSTKVVLVDERGCSFTASLPLGTLRMRGHQAGRSAAAGDTFLLEQHAARVLSPTLAHVRALGFDLVALSGETARGLLRLTLAEKATTRDPAWLWSSTPRLTFDALERLLQRLSALPEPGRVQLAGLPPESVDGLLPGAIAVRAILERLQADAAEVTASGLREGLIADYVRKRHAVALSHAMPLAPAR